MAGSRSRMARGNDRPACCLLQQTARTVGYGFTATNPEG
jgi:hypothetical protein